MKKKTAKKYPKCFLCGGREFGEKYLVYDYCEYVCHICLLDLLEKAIAKKKRR